MNKIFVGLTYTKAQITSGVPVSVYTGPSLSAARAAVAAPVNAGTASKGVVVSNLFLEQRPVRRNPGGA